MPKVSEQYFEEKRNQIMDVTYELSKEIPLYQITMRDVIKRVGCSQGLIYRYYKSVDEIYVDLVNREITSIEFQSKIDTILSSELTEERMLEEGFTALGNYIYEVQEKISGKLFYEIQVSYVFDETKQKELLTNLLIKQNMNYFEAKMMEFIIDRVEKGIFHPKVSLEMLALYTGAVIDGISNRMAVFGNGNMKRVQNESISLFAMLSNYVMNCLGLEG